MAVKKTAKTSSVTKAAPKKAAAKKSAAAPKKKAAKASAAKTAPKKAAAKKSAAPKKKAAPVKLTEKHAELLKKVKEHKDGYLATKSDAKALESLQTKKLVKRGAKDKASGSYRYTVSKAGEKHLGAPAPAPAPKSV
jgi:predicted transglutaminase-like cysteine proteinase